jgi:undecaprenyl-diphosphatase
MASTKRPALTEVLRDLGRLDLAVYRAIAATPTPTLDEPLRRLSDVATRSKLWLGIAAAMAAVGGRTGRRAAVTGVAALGINSVVVNLVGKLSFRRLRPDRAGTGVPEARHVRMPSSPSFPSGHAASGFAFADAIAESAPAIAMPLRVLAAVVAYSRVHTGVHYPGDVIVGALIGSSIGESVGFAARVMRRPRGGAKRVG